MVCGHVLQMHVKDKKTSHKSINHNIHMQLNYTAAAAAASADDDDDDDAKNHVFK